MSKSSTIVGDIDSEVLAFTAGRDIERDLELIEVDCIGTAAHVRTLSALKGEPILNDRESLAIIAELNAIIDLARAGKFRITSRDQDVHLAVEKAVTRKLGELGKKVHTARSRNDQAACDLRLYGKISLLEVMDAVAAAAKVFLWFGKRHENVPMVGRTHMQPAMPSSVGLWASSFAEALMDDMMLLKSAFEFNDKCPLGSAASYGVPLPLDRKLTARLLGFRGGPVHNVLYAGNSRGKCECVIISAVAQVMLTLSRWAADLMLYTMPEFNYFTLSSGVGTGSSIMPQKNNPDILELTRARAALVTGHASMAAGLVAGLPGGYNRDVQEIKGPFIEALATTTSCCRMAELVMKNLKVNKDALLAGFTPGVFATDAALEQVAAGAPFREAYNNVKRNGAGDGHDPFSAMAKRTHAGGIAGLDWEMMKKRASEQGSFARRERLSLEKSISALLDREYKTS